MCGRGGVRVARSLDELHQSIEVGARKMRSSELRRPLADRAAQCRVRDQPAHVFDEGRDAAVRTETQPLVREESIRVDAETDDRHLP